MKGTGVGYGDLGFRMIPGERRALGFVFILFVEITGYVYARVSRWRCLFMPNVYMRFRTADCHCVLLHPHPGKRQWPGDGRGRRVFEAVYWNILKKYFSIL